ncbi:hypothetical protein Ddc_12074 [Ditylenchus destructor]|nr:hypothetical protein Ddc_12074 [Ditylenchus destructor]
MSLLIVAILLSLTDLAKLEAGVEFGHSAKSGALTGPETLFHEARSSSNAKGSDCSQEVVNVARAFTSEMMAQMSKVKRLATEGRLTLLHNHRNCLDQPSAPLSIHMLASGHLLFAGPLEKFTSFGFIYVLNLGQNNVMGRREGRK